ncbi:hypothetical protein D3C79_819700 [compost metagenome]
MIGRYHHGTLLNQRCRQPSLAGVVAAAAVAEHDQRETPLGHRRFRLAFDTGKHRVFPDPLRRTRGQGRVINAARQLARTGMKYLIVGGDPVSGGISRPTQQQPQKQRSFHFYSSRCMPMRRGWHLPLHPATSIAIEVVK